MTEFSLAIELSYKLLELQQSCLRLGA